MQHPLSPYSSNICKFGSFKETETREFSRQDFTKFTSRNKMIYCNYVVKILKKNKVTSKCNWRQNSISLLRQGTWRSMAHASGLNKPQTMECLLSTNKRTQSSSTDFAIKMLSALPVTFEISIDQSSQCREEWLRICKYVFKTAYQKTCWHIDCCLLRYQCVQFNFSTLLTSRVCLSVREQQFWLINETTHYLSWQAGSPSANPEIFSLLWK
jgi:hypothetical protein